MFGFRCHGITTILVAIILLLLRVRAQSDNSESSDGSDEATEAIGVTEVPNDLWIDRRPGRYVPELHGAARGKYVPDYRGIYQHIHRPYDGGYGDRGLKYQHFLDRKSGGDFGLGPRDHLRFMIDFNFNGSGWQVVQFDWVRDGDEDHQISYVNENQLGSGVRKQQVASGANSARNGPNVHVEGEVDANNEQQEGTDENGEQVTTIQHTISEVLTYIQTYILPTLD